MRTKSGLQLRARNLRCSNEIQLEKMYMNQYTIFTEIDLFRNNRIIEAIFGVEFILLLGRIYAFAELNLCFCSIVLTHLLTEFSTKKKLFVSSLPFLILFFHFHSTFSYNT